MKPSRRLVVTVIASAVLLAGFIGVGVYGLVRGPGTPPGARMPISSSATPVAEPSAPSGYPPKLPGLTHTDDPIRYARSVARALFTWTTVSGLSPDNYATVITEDADPAGIETSGLVTDVAEFFPTSTQWQELRQYQTSETLSIASASVPAAWAQALASGDGQVRPGTTAITITGTRHRAGVWFGRESRTSDPVSLTVFVACTPTFSRCHVLRLSGLNTPLR